MNLKEGTRRLALLLGVGGAIAGGFASYVELQTTLEQRASHIKFEQLANSDAAKQATSDWLARNTPAVQNDRDNRPRYVQLPYGEYMEWPQGVSATDFKAKAQQYMTNEWASFPQTRKDELLKKMTPQQIEELDLAIDPWARYRRTPPPIVASEVDKGGIKTIHWTKDYRVESIETGDGQTLYPTPTPSAWMYLLIALSPVLGFLIPWGAIRAIGWVATGFVASPK